MDLLDYNNSTLENVMAPGTQARLICDWKELSIGEYVSVIRYDPHQGYLVRTNSNLEELWLPCHVLTSNNRKPWSFRFRKPSFATQGRRSIDVGSIHENIAEVTTPEFRDKICDITAECGAKVAFKCRIKSYTRNIHVSWRKTEPDPSVMRNSGRFVLMQTDDGTAMLIINNLRSTDAGTYLCSISNEVGSSQCSAVLRVSDLLPPLREPKIQVISSNSVLLEWENDSYSQFLVEYCKLGTGEWISPNGNTILNSNSYTVEHLIPGETYSFRIVAAQNKLVSLPSLALTLPVSDNLRWQQEQFIRRYIELEEIARGRYSVVRKARDRGTGLEVALKQVSRRKQAHKVTQAEYALLAGMQHINIIHAMALFDNAPVPGLDTIVLELVKGPLLFAHICQNDEYTEAEISLYLKQLMSALSWLHESELAHLDVKPENIMVDVSNPNITPVLKLIDFGDCVNTIKNIVLQPACLEFASPELVLGKPVGIHTDCWAVGVLLYVLLSGVSPFLDDSVEETTANILKCDFFFPEDYFSQISADAIELIKKLLVFTPNQRINMEDCLQSAWMKNISNGKTISSARLRTFIVRRHPMNPPPTTPTTPSNNSIFA